jgi:hypothetical protein
MAGARGIRKRQLHVSHGSDRPVSQRPFVYNECGQPIDLNGKPGSNAVTHIPREPDGSYPRPEGWGK